MKIISVVGARPNFMKIAPFIRAVNKYNQRHPDKYIQNILLHTGQHYDDTMSNNFFNALSIPDADINLGIGSGTHAEQVGNTMIEFEKVLKKEQPDWVVVVGDVNATLSCSVTAKKQNIKLCHIEAGLRSRDMTMPEEINRLVTDRLSDLLLTPDTISSQNLLKEGVNPEKVSFVGNIMIDTLEANRAKAKKLKISEIIQKNIINNISKQKFSGDYALMTMHRPSNVDHVEVLKPLVNFLIDEVASKLSLVWPVHPRSRKKMEKFDLWDRLSINNNIFLLEPIDYNEMLRLNMDATIMLTDSGGLQEECCVLGTPCLTLRWNTERPVTLLDNGGSAIMVGNDVGLIKKGFNEMLSMTRKPNKPEFWDGHTAERCLKAILDHR
jgi:UDP-N-acetylglucosamine 2-epimerase (non-hydrolysing)